MKTTRPLWAWPLATLAGVLGTSAGAAVNLVPNGDFELGVSGFTTSYTLVSGAFNSLTPESTYYVGTDPALYHGLFSSYGDHTSGSGNMMIINGSPDTTIDVWRTASSIAVTPNTLYYFEAWISSAHPNSPAKLTFGLDGDTSDAILGVGDAPSTTGLWEPLSFVWDSGANTSVNLYLNNANPAFGGNDFAIDDIYLGLQTSIPPVPEASTILAGVGLAGVLAAGIWRRRR